MILTGKTKKDFEEWTNTNYSFLKLEVKGSGIDILEYIENSNMLNALIIEFFDSVGITVDVIPVLNNPIKWMPNPFWIEKEISTDDSEYYETRTEATIEAIKKANEIYNAN